MQRKTNQRDAIRRALEITDRPLGPQEIWEIAKQDAPSLGIATVYRALKSLVEEKWIVPVELPGQPPRYERGGKGHHHHFQCFYCNGVFEVDIEGCPDTLGTRLPTGYRMEAHEVFLYGRCPECAESETP